MKLMLLPPPLLLLLLLLHLPIWKSHFFYIVHAAQDSLVSSSASSPIYPSSTSMSAFSPGTEIELGIKEGHKNMKLDKRLALFLFIACGLLAGVIVLSLLCWFICYLNLSRKRGRAQCSDMEKVNGRGSVPSIEYKILEKGSDNFRDGNLLGVGGFGRVYKALLDDDTYVAVKKLDCGNEDAQREFENEVDLLSRVQHPNIISLMGYTVHEDMGFIVYELMPNGSLQDLLHGPSHGSSLSWHMRLKIALDTARGLEYLHEFCKPAVIHRDLKSSNILLDSNFNAKLSDFGLAVANSSHNQNKHKLSGTVGYVAPEYMLDGELTDKSDVYAFGVVLLELLLGRRPVEKLAPAHCQSIVTWAMPQLTNRALLPNIVDPAIKDAVDEKYLFQVAAVAVLCVQPEPSYRPLITDVVHSLVPMVPLELGGTLRVAQPRSRPPSEGHQRS